MSELGNGALPPSAPSGSSYLLLAISRHVPESVSPALANSGDWNRHRTWYQWVRGSVGAVDSHTVILPSKDRHILDGWSHHPVHLELSSGVCPISWIPQGPGAKTGWPHRPLHTHT